MDKVVWYEMALIWGLAIFIVIVDRKNWNR